MKIKKRKNKEKNIQSKKNNPKHICHIVPNSNPKIVERGKIDIHRTQIHDCLLLWLGTCISILKNGEVKLVLRAQNLPLSVVNCNWLSYSINDVSLYNYTLTLSVTDLTHRVQRFKVKYSLCLYGCLS